MRRLPLTLSLTLASIAMVSAAALADIHARIAVRPDSIPQCGHGRLFVALGNSGEHPIVARVEICLRHVPRDSTIDSTCVLGPFFGRVRLGAGERRAREFDFRLPSLVPPGRYAWTLRAIANDST